MAAESVTVSDLSVVLSASCTALAALAAALISGGTGSRNDRRWLIVLIITLAGLAATPLVARFTPGLLPAWFPLLLGFLYALPVALWRYIEVLTLEGASPEKRARLWPHAVLPGVAFLIASGYWLLPQAEQRLIFLNGEIPPGVFPAFLLIVTFGLVLIWSFFSAGYLVAIVKRLIKHRAGLKDVYSNLTPHEHRWVDLFIATLVILWLLVAASLFADNLLAFSLLTLETGMAAGAFLLFYLSFWVLRVRPQAESVGDRDIPREEAPEKYLRSGLDPARTARITERLGLVMENRELYLDPNLTLPKLAGSVGASPNLVSQILNQTLGMTFFDYVNSWRVKAAKLLLVQEGETVLAIALAVGFNSKSTFYKAFKNAEGVAPGIWRQQKLREGRERPDQSLD